MSFMAGFGEAFSSSFQKETDRLEKRKQDEIDKQWETYKENLKQDKANRQDWKFAESVVADNQLPSGAAQKIYEWKQLGYSIPQIQEMIQEGSFKQTRAGTEVQTQYIDPRDQETQEATGQQPVGVSSPNVPPFESPTGPSEQATPTANKRDTNFFSNISSRFKNLPQPGQTPAINPAKMEKRQNQAAKRAGIDPEEFRRVASGNVFAPPAMEEMPAVAYQRNPPKPEPDKFDQLNEAALEIMHARRSGDQERMAIAEERYQILVSQEALKADLAAASQGLTSTRSVDVYKDGKYSYSTITTTKNGQQVDAITGQPIDGTVVEKTERQYKLESDIASSIQKPISDLQSKKSGFTSATRSYLIMDDIVKKTDGAVLAPATATMFQKGEEWMMDGLTAAKRVNDAFAEDKGDGSTVVAQGKAELGRLERIRQNIIASGNQTLGAQKTLFEIQKAMMAYQIGIMVGQEGRSIAETERAMFMEMASAGVTPERFQQGMADLLMPRVREIDEQSKAIYDNDQNLKLYEGEFGRKPKAFTYQSFEEDLKNRTDEVGQAYKQLSQYTRHSNVAPPVTKTEEDPSAGIPTVSSFEEYQELVSKGVIDLDSIPAGQPIFRTKDGKVWKKPANKGN